MTDEEEKISEILRKHLYSPDLAQGEFDDLKDDILISFGPIKRIFELKEALSVLYVEIVADRSDADLIIDLGDTPLLHAISFARAVLSASPPLKSAGEEPRSGDEISPTGKGSPDTPCCNEAIAKEREECAKIAEERAAWAREMYNSNYRACMADHIASAIRGRNG